MRLQLGADEPDRHDPVLLRRPQQPGARPVTRVLVLERHLAEPSEGIPNVRRVVDRQPTSPVRIDVREGAVGELRALFRAEPSHAHMFARTRWAAGGACRPPPYRQDATGSATGSGRITTVSATSWISSAGIPTRCACRRITALSTAW